MENGMVRLRVMDGEQGNACAVWCKKNLKEKGQLEDLE